MPDGSSPTRKLIQRAEDDLGSGDLLVVLLKAISNPSGELDVDAVRAITPRLIEIVRYPRSK